MTTTLHGVKVINNIYPFYSGSFSNFFPSVFTVDDDTYSCGEQWIMSQKAELFGDIEMKIRIMGVKTPATMKKYGRKVRNYDEAVWAARRMEIAKRGLREKFRQNEVLRKLLLETHPYILVEASPIDKIWGVGLRSNNSDIYHKEKWKGHNALGEILMSIRSELLQQ